MKSGSCQPKPRTSLGTSPYRRVLQRFCDGEAQIDDDARRRQYAANQFHIALFESAWAIWCEVVVGTAQDETVFSTYAKAVSDRIDERVSGRRKHCQLR